MKNRSIAAVILLPFVTFGIYTLYWHVSTKGELNERGATIPTAWLIIIPLVNIWWMWKYYEGAEKVTNGKVSGVLMFILALLVTSIISSAICQDAYNKFSSVTAPAPEAPQQPAVA
jgi:membrane protease YdiL (CAAX protease family)